MTGMVYAIKVVGHDLFKIGNTRDPVQRMQNLKGQSPFPMIYTHLLDVGSKERASVFEAFILSHCKVGFDHGEWVRGRALVDAVFEMISPAVSVLEDFPNTATCRERSRKPIGLDELQKRCAEADDRLAERADFYTRNPQWDHHGYADQARLFTPDHGDAA